MCKMKFAGWNAVAEKLIELAKRGIAVHPLQSGGQTKPLELRDGQAESLQVLAQRLPQNGMLIADEVGMGKTLLACLLARCVSECGGRVAIVIPPNLGYQWQDELNKFNLGSNTKFVRSLGEFFSAWPDTESENLEDTHWFNQPIVLLPHGFSNWRISKDSAHWRWALPAMMHAHLRKRGETIRYPNSYYDFSKNVCWSVYHAAHSIVDYHLKQKGKISKHILDEIAEPDQWNNLKNVKQFSAGSQLRNLLEKSIGLGLGHFDLIIIDEAHKSRGYDSKLSQLLDNVIQTHPDSRWIAMTATPVELDSTQWQDMLKRIRISDDVQISDTVQRYIDAVNQVKRTPHNPQAVAAYGKTADAFQAALKPYVIRRDKRNTKAIQSFINAKGGSAYDYLKREEISIDVKNLPDQWKTIVCASEALSLVANNDMRLKRLRLTVSNGHGIASLCDSLESSDSDLEAEAECKNDEDNNSGNKNEKSRPTISISDAADTSHALNKKQQRAQWWSNVIHQQLEKSGAPMFNHPHLMATIAKVEELTNAGEKVLIFGRFTKPLSALTQLLNARTMLRTVFNKAETQFWPQSKVHETDTVAVEIALKQLQLTKSLQEVNNRLEAQYQQLEKQRKSARDTMITDLRDAIACSEKAEPELITMLDCIESDTDTENKRALFHALQDLKESDSPQGLLDTFKEIIASFNNDTNKDQDPEISGSKYAQYLWQTIALQLKNDFIHQQSAFARFMSGNTSMSSRQLMKVAFNREGVNPRVLVAQSMVGREGLNLHKACRHVVLFHPEWNPGVIEQQIGRVDRFESRWEKLLEEAVAEGKSGSELPKIHVHCVMFKDTYDEQHWAILQKRWDDLRAQLHGVILSPEDSEQKKTINGMAPSFSPINTSNGMDSSSPNRH